MGRSLLSIAIAVPTITALAVSAGCAGSPQPVADAIAAAPGQPAPAVVPQVAAVSKPQYVRRIDPGQTGWFSSPSLVDLNGDGQKEIVAPLYSTYVYSAAGKRLATGTATKGRVYAPSVVADLDHDGITEVVVGGSGSVGAYEWRGGTLVKKA
ncbi:MAG: VCBS repeat-containing protein, partial [Propionibacteriales bacterium]|nr:VCBS repeat-containing protein [Propionibacteriales bacterium]